MRAFYDKELHFWRQKWEAGNITEEEWLERQATLKENSGRLAALLGEESDQEA